MANRTMSKAAFCALLILSALSPTLRASAQARARQAQAAAGVGRRRELFGVKLRPQAIRLLDRVEKKYGRRVREEPDSALGEGVHAYAAMDLDGTPVIKIRRGVAPTEAIIVHELLHHAYDFPTVEFVPYAGWATQENVAYVQFLLAHVYGSIQHRMFFPQMRAMGLNPDDEVRSGVEYLLRQDAFAADVKGVLPKEARAVAYFKAAMNTADPDLLLRLARRYEKNGWAEALAAGRRLVKIVADARPRTVDDAAQVFVRCLNHIRRGDARFRLRERTVKKIGAYEEPWVSIEVRPN